MLYHFASTNNALQKSVHYEQKGKNFTKISSDDDLYLSWMFQMMGKKFFH